VVNASRPAHQPRAAQRRRGFTLIELMITLAVASILAAISVPAYSRLIATQRINAVSSDLYLSLVKARSEAVKRNINVTLAPVGGVWTSGWTTTDANNLMVNRHAAVVAVSIASAPAAVTFLSSGRILGSLAPSFQLSSTTAALTRCISADPSGRPYAKSAAC